MKNSYDDNSNSVRWPTVIDYNEAVQNLSDCFRDEELRRGAVERGPIGPLPYSGAFADVYRVQCAETGNTWAVKLFKRDVRGLRDRYRAISEHLAKVRLPFMVDFVYQEEGVRIGGRWYPLVKLRWVEGISLHQYVVRALAQPRILEPLSALWLRLAKRLRDAEVAHADLQHGNVVLVPADAGRNLQLKLIDYDGMYVPALADQGSYECGHRNYQHPRRGADNLFGLDVDRFSHLAICCALRCLTVGGRHLWERFGTDECLLFQESDFVAPENSAVFQELWTLRDTDARMLVGHLALASRRPLHATPHVDELIAPDGRVRPLNVEEMQEVCALWTPIATDRRVMATAEEAPAEEAPAVTSLFEPTGTIVPVDRPAASEETPEQVVIDVSRAAHVAPLPRGDSVRDWVIDADQRLADWLGPENAELHKFLRVLLVVAALAIPTVAGAWLVSQFRAPPEGLSLATLGKLAGDTTSDRLRSTAEARQLARGLAERAALSARSVAISTRDGTSSAMADLGEFAEPKPLREGRRLFADAERAFERELFEDAERLFERARSQFQLAARDAAHLSQACELRRTWERGIAEMDSVAKSSSEMLAASGQAELAARAFEEAQFQTAVERYETAIRRQGAARAAAELTGHWQAAIEKGDRVRAEFVFKEFARLRPNDPRLATWKARLSTLGSEPPAAASITTSEPIMNDLGMKFRRIPAGDFSMGTRSNGRENERPEHVITISRDFYLGVYEVTQKQYSTIMGDNPSRFRGDDLPVEGVSAADAEEFCRKLSVRELDRSKQYHLPTEAEWEYAARAGANTLWCGGDIETTLGEYAWYRVNSKMSTHAVGGKRPNAWGLFDMHGNVYEWCQDDFDQSAYALRRGNFTDPLVRLTGRQRVVRGGSWSDSADGCRSACRYGVDPTVKREFYGFRVACYVP